MTLTSPVFLNGEQIPPKYTCEGIDINPTLNISSVPKSAKSLVLIVRDPDAPSKDFNHWIVFNIDPRITIIKENSVPKDSIEGITDFGNIGYGGPCPRIGEHRYLFTLYALDTVLNLESGVKKTDVLEAMKGHIIEQTELIGKYKLSRS